MVGHVYPPPQPAWGGLWKAPGWNPQAPLGDRQQRLLRHAQERYTDRDDESQPILEELFSSLRESEGLEEQAAATAAPSSPRAGLASGAASETVGRLAFYSSAGEPDLAASTPAETWAPDAGVTHAEMAPKVASPTARHTRKDSSVDASPRGLEVDLAPRVATWPVPIRPVVDLSGKLRGRRGWQLPVLKALASGSACGPASGSA